MKTYSQLAKVDLARQLIAGGYLPVNKPDAGNDLVMEQGPVNFETCLVELPGGRTGILVDLIIGNPRSGHPVHLDLQKFSIEIPWCQINWLEKPEPLQATIPAARKPGPRMYFLPGMPTLAFAKDEALNHRLKRGCVLLPGNEIAGPLMGLGERPIPNGFHDRQRFTTCLLVYYERGKRCDLQVDFMVCREPHQAGPRSSSRPRSNRRCITRD